jgi:hypothetical protein
MRWLDIEGEPNTMIIGIMSNPHCICALNPYPYDRWWGKPHMYSVAWSDDGKFLLLNMGKQYHGEIKFVAWGIGSFLAAVPETDEILLIDGLVLKV